MNFIKVITWWTVLKIWEQMGIWSAQKTNSQIWEEMSTTWLKIPQNGVKMWQLTLFCSLSRLLEEEEEEEEEEAEPMNKRWDEIA